MVLKILQIGAKELEIVTKQLVLVSFRFILFSKFSNKCAIQNIEKIDFECTESILAFGKEIDSMFDFDVTSPQP